MQMSNWVVTVINLDIRTKNRVHQSLFLRQKNLSSKWRTDEEGSWLYPHAASAETNLPRNVNCTAEVDEIWVSAELGFGEIHLWVLCHEPTVTQETQTAT